MNDLNQDENGEEIMQTTSFRLKPTLYEAAKEKAGLIGLSKIMRRLVEMWVKGDIKIPGVDDR